MNSVRAGSEPACTGNVLDEPDDIYERRKIMEKWKLLLGSRKFWAAVIGLAFLVIRHFDPTFEVPENETIAFVSVLAAYILGVAVEDGLKANGS